VTSAATSCGIICTRRGVRPDGELAPPAGHVRQYEDILRAIHSGAEPGVRVSDAVLALAAVRAVYVSSTLGRPVLFDDVVAGKYNNVKVRTGKQ